MPNVRDFKNSKPIPVFWRKRKPEEPQPTTPASDESVKRPKVDGEHSEQTPRSCPPPGEARDVRRNPAKTLEEEGITGQTLMDAVGGNGLFEGASTDADNTRNASSTPTPRVVQTRSDGPPIICCLWRSTVDQNGRTVLRKTEYSFP